MSDKPMTGGALDVLVVGAGPTGLSLAAELLAHGVTPRIVDRGQDRVHESRALAIQPRTLEVLARLGVTADLVANGNPAVQLRVHVRGRTLVVPLFDLGLDDTAYPYLLFLSQAEIERILEEHIAGAGVIVERETELVDATATSDAVVATLRHPDGAMESVTASYVVGCDGAHSTVRKHAGIAFRGSAYAQTFVLADIEADGVEPGAAHVFLAGSGMLFLVPLGQPASWRMIAMRSPADRTTPETPVTLDEVQAIADTYTDASVRLRDPVWMTNFRIHHRGATHYRAGRIFLAGDAAHIHSPAGGQGMNTGIQDATNLGWKLAHTIRGLIDPYVLDTYDTERAPVGRTVLRFTDRATRIGTSKSPIVRFARTRLAPAVIPMALKAKAGRAYVFRALSQLGIHYRGSPLSTDGQNTIRGPHAGDRLPDAPVVHNGQTTSLHAATGAPGWHLLLCGPTESWAIDQMADLSHRYAGSLNLHRLSSHQEPGILYDTDGHALGRLGLTPQDNAQYLIRPDGHIGYRAGGVDLAGLAHYLRRWLTA